MFGRKTACERCDRKVRSKQAVYLRGSYFCGASCRDAWAAEHPAPIATGPDLRREATVTIDAVVIEFDRAFGLAPLRSYDDELGSVAGDIATRVLDSKHRTIESDIRNSALVQFHTFILRCPPLLRALGRADAANAIDSVDIMKTIEDAFSTDTAVKRLTPLIDTLRRVRVELGDSA